MLTTSYIILSGAFLLGCANESLVIGDLPASGTINTGARTPEQSNTPDPRNNLLNVVRGRAEFIKIAHLVEPRIV